MPQITLRRPNSLRTRGFQFFKDRAVTVPPAVYAQLKDDPRFETSHSTLAIAVGGEGSLQPRKRTRPTVRMSEVFGDNGKNPHQTAAGDELSEHDPRGRGILEGTSRYEAGDPIDPTRRYADRPEGVVTGMAPTIINDEDDGLAGINPENQGHARREIVTEAMLNEDGARKDGDKSDGSGEGGRREISQAPDKDPPNGQRERVEELRAAMDLVDDDIDGNFDARGVPTPEAFKHITGWLPTVEDINAALPPPAPTTHEREQEGKGTQGHGLKIKRQHKGSRRASMGAGENLDTGADRARDSGEGEGEGVEV